MRAELTAQDCLFMGKHAFNAGIYARAIEWFQESYVLAGLENNRTVRQDQVMEFVQHTIKLVSRPVHPFMRYYSFVSIAWENDARQLNVFRKGEIVKDL